MLKNEKSRQEKVYVDKKDYVTLSSNPTMKVCIITNSTSRDKKVSKRTGVRLFQQPTYVFT